MAKINSNNTSISLSKKYIKTTVIAIKVRHFTNHSDSTKILSFVFNIFMLGQKLIKTPTIVKNHSS